jgi:hypothetical protein
MERGYFSGWGASTLGGVGRFTELDRIDGINRIMGLPAATLSVDIPAFADTHAVIATEIRDEHPRPQFPPPKSVNPVNPVNPV